MIKIDYKYLKQVCLSDIESFEPLGEVFNTKDGLYIYRENPNAKILAVAHLDTVVNTSHFHHVKIAGESIVLNAQLDDRLGVYTMLDILPQLGIEYDLLLTEGEEMGCSTAAYFESQKEYNWMFSFDRRGADVVMYQYDNEAIRDDLQQAKLKPSTGSFSDIVFLDHLGICGINIGTGYEGEHSKMSYANINTLCKQAKRFKEFYDLFQDKKYPYTRTSKTTRYTPFYDKSKLPAYDVMMCYLCDADVGKHQIINDIFLCDYCMGQAAQCTHCHDIMYAEEIIDGICEHCEGYDE